MYSGYDYGMDEPSSPVKKSNERSICVKLNGNSFFMQTLRFKKNEITKFPQLKKFINKGLNLKMNDYNKLRIFNQDG